MILGILGACRKDGPKNDPITYGNSYELRISTNKARYQLGETVQFSLNQQVSNAAKIRYRHLGETISEVEWTGKQWTWQAPASDFTGYLVDLYQTKDGKEQVLASVAVDVSSDWTRFPRYGFLTNFGNLTNDQVKAQIEYLNRHHINGIQYYDWLYKHHWPLAGTAAAPQSVWTEIANKEVYLQTLKNYIAAASNSGMQSMFYNLAFGALNDASADGVKDEWYVFKDVSHNIRDRHDLPQPFFKSDIEVLDAGNEQWQQYLAARNADVYATLDFDGYHVDALGDRGTLYNYAGSRIDQAGTFKPFLLAMKNAAPQKRLVMNAVNQYGQEGSIAEAPVDFLYTEVWGPNDYFSDLASVLQNNQLWGGGDKASVLAAYVNYQKADNPGYFNTPAVLLADAVIFAFGGAHLELGEHMLGKEYFPNNNLQMTDELKKSLIRYYDFLVAYENLLRDGGSFNQPAVTCTNGKLTTAPWPASPGVVAVQGKKWNKRQVIHLFNFSQANSLRWRDTDGTQAKPDWVEGATISIAASPSVKKVWMASPDHQNAVAIQLPFTQTGNTVTCTIPSLLYWDMLVLEY